MNDRHFNDKMKTMEAIILDVHATILYWSSSSTVMKGVRFENLVTRWEELVFADPLYLLVYFSILYFRYLAGIVTDEMLLLPKGPYLAVGFLEAIAAASGMAAGANLSGATIPILSQTFLVWQLLLSVIFLGRRYKVNQIAGCFLVAIGVIITVTSGSGAGVSLKDVGIFWILLMVSSFFFQAADTVLKEVIFLNAAKKLKGGTLDLFVVNSFGSAFQALFICLLLPFLSKLWGVPFSQLPSYLKDGAACFINIGALSKGCQGAPLLPLLFIVVNMAFNVSLLHLVKISSAVVSCLASTLSGISSSLYRSRRTISPCMAEDISWSKRRRSDQLFAKGSAAKRLKDRDLVLNSASSDHQ
ncbi:hypothetical protein GIB67_030522 [Kingdonia uniflora]|uniref:Uncharacterized protein n=1 Tax=Kingdonia uniflora TaxID=39325 RepID=A0A7J7LCM9_9MAGN|nr:hypothetical protein GIB67_030522 [Kingdonia uniflora]